MNRQDEMNSAYSFYTANAPEVENTDLDESLPNVEQLVVCQCFKQYRVRVNGKNPVSDFVMDGVFCPHCGLPAAEYRSVSGHSAGVFNATMTRGHRGK